MSDKKRTTNTLPSSGNVTTPRVTPEELVYERYRRIRDDKMDWMEDRSKKEQMYFNNQWDKDVKDVYEDEGVFPVTINLIRPRIVQRVALMIARNPSGVVYGYLTGDQDVGLRLNHFLSYIQYISNFKWVAENVLLASQRTGVGYFTISIDQDADYGRGEIKIGWDSYNHVFVDKNIGEWDYGNAPYVIHSRLEDLENFTVDYDGKYPEGGVLDDFTMTSDEIAWDGEGSRDDGTDTKILNVDGSGYKDQFIRVYDQYEKVLEDVRVMKYITGAVRPLSEDYKVTDNDYQLIKAGQVKIDEMRVPRIKLTRCFGNSMHMHKFDEIVLPISNYPIVPVICEYTGNTLHVGEIDFTEGLQEFRNKCASMMVDNAGQMSNPRTFADTKIISDPTLKKQVEDAFYNHKKLIWQPRGPNGEWAMETQKPQSINQAFAFLVQFFGGSIDSVMSTWEFMAGNPEKVPNTATMGLSISEAAKDQLKLPLNHFESALERVFNLVLELVPHTYKERKEFLITGRDGEPTGGTSVINEAVYDADLKKYTTHYDVTKFQARYRIIPGSTLPPNAIAKLNLYKDLAQSHPVFLKYLVENLPSVELSEKEEIIKEIDLIPQMQQQLEQLTKIIKDLKSAVKSANNKRETAELQERLLRQELKEVRKSENKQPDTSEEKK